MFFGVFWFAKKHKFLKKGGIHSISRSQRDTFIFYCMRWSSLVEMTGDDNSAADDHDTDVQTKQYMFSLYCCIHGTCKSSVPVPL